MYTLDLDRLNLRSPYYVWKVKDGVYAFDTDYEVSYEIGLSVNVEMLQMEVCAFDINNINHKPSAFFLLPSSLSHQPSSFFPLPSAIIKDTRLSQMSLAFCKDSQKIE